MRIPIFLTIAFRYLPGVKSRNPVNMLSRISVLGMGTGAFALIVVLSVFNGFEGLVSRLYHSFYPDLQCTPLVGKTFVPRDEWKKKILDIPGVAACAGVLEEQAYFEYGGQSFIGVVKGVGKDYTEVNPLDTFVFDGIFQTLLQDQHYAVVGGSIARAMGVSTDAPLERLSITLPARSSGFSIQPESEFRSMLSPVSGIFAVQQEIDSRYVFTDLKTLQDVSSRTDEISAFEIRLHPFAVSADVSARIQDLLGKEFVIKTRYEQQAFVYRMMKIERWVVIGILSFILLVISFNIIGSLSMLIMDKRKDSNILSAMGMTSGEIRKIFLATGILQGIMGAITGLTLGVLLCFFQQKWGFIRMGGPETAFIVPAYPVDIHAVDILLVAAIVIGISWIASGLPVRRILRTKVSLK